MTSGYNATDYCALADVKAACRISDTQDDAQISIAITAASRAIDEFTARQFGITGSAVQRNFTALRADVTESRPSVEINDLMDLTTGPPTFVFYLSFDGTQTLTMVNGTDFDLWPWNAPADGVPYTRLVMRPLGRMYLPYWTRGIQITANWGYATVPPVVKAAAILQASRFFVRRDSPYGVAGSVDLGSQVRLLQRLDPDVQVMLAQVKRWYGVR